MYAYIVYNIIRAIKNRINIYMPTPPFKIKPGMPLDLGEQPIAMLMQKFNLAPHDLVKNSTQQITHKMVARAMKGRRLTRHVQIKILNAFNSAAKTKYSIENLFTYTA